MLAYDLRGHGPRNIILLHGFLGSGRNLASLARRWTDADPSLRIILPDLTGHGASPPLPPHADLTTMARDVLALGHFLHVPRPFTLVGHSLGGRVALAARLLDSDAVQDVTLLDISPAPMSGLLGESHDVLQRLLSAPATAESREVMRDYFTAGGISGPLADWVLMNLLHEGGFYRWRVDRETLGQFHLPLVHADLWPAISLAGGHIRCIRGGASNYVSDAVAAQLTAKGCEVITLAGAGHFVHVDAPQALLTALQEPH